MAVIPAVHLSMLCLALLCVSVLGQSTVNSTLSVHSEQKGQRSETNATEPNSTTTAALETNKGADSHGTTHPPDELPITKHTAPVSRSTLITPPGTPTQPQEATGGKVSTVRSDGKTPKPTAGSTSSSITIAVVLVVLLTVLVILALYGLSLFQNRRWARNLQGALRRAAARARTVLGRAAVCFWPGKRGELGEGDEEEDEEEEGNGERGGDMELGNMVTADGKKEKMQEEEEDSSDDYSSMEGFDLRERAKERERGEDKEEKERGKNPSQGEDTAEEGKSKEGEMEECDLTAL